MPWGHSWGISPTYRLCRVMCVNGRKCEKVLEKSGRKKHCIAANFLGKLIGEWHEKCGLCVTCYRGIKQPRSLQCNNIRTCVCIFDSK